MSDPIIQQINSLLQEQQVRYSNEIKELKEIIKKKDEILNNNTTSTSVAKLTKVEFQPDIVDPITLNIGGSEYQTTKETLLKVKGSYFDKLLKGEIKATNINDKSNSFFIDRDGTNFKYILNYLRTEDPLEIPQSILNEIDKDLAFYKIYIEHLPSPSVIVDQYQIANFSKWIGKKSNLTLLYRGTRNGFKASTFHSLCDGKGPTITLIKSDDLSIFGGYNSQSWNSENKFYGDDQCFIFTMLNHVGVPPTKYYSKDQSYVKGDPDSGPIFGAAHDINIIDRANIARDDLCYQSFPYSYFCL
ncbi:hypothetical protein DFA_02135 [Cavenderia fasciculata]|uniref:TLDc domain-containing protein n=1 Tax=Cavenderia fasciculata TaxID=261658 RepID=F4PYT2_CACFS|nr:uncharacterized protein DFA_02135 [Cavenderia fasciculata]EGG19348.1 hypothetical protein DFA_02135 [Cavenderia fasciculata]|eukprot:XP_004357619.1 hypothetical protein DFA_02135 [Cavenderia fasciculata]